MPLWCLFALSPEITCIFLFSDIGATAVVSLAIQTSIVGVKRKQGQKEQFAVHAGALFLEISQKML